MNFHRWCHGLQKMAQRIFAFGGSDYDFDPMKNAEVYDVVKNQWKNLPDMPEKYFGITCVRLQNQILMCSWEFRLISYDIDNEAYSFVG